MKYRSTKFHLQNSVCTFDISIGTALLKKKDTVQSHEKNKIKEEKKSKFSPILSTFMYYVESKSFKNDNLTRLCLEILEIHWISCWSILHLLICVYRFSWLWKPLFYYNFSFPKWCNLEIKFYNYPMNFIFHQILKGTNL